MHAQAGSGRQSQDITRTVTMAVLHKRWHRIAVTAYAMPSAAHAGNSSNACTAGGGVQENKD
jgi:hypothetical protein